MSLVTTIKATLAELSARVDHLAEHGDANGWRAHPVELDYYRMQLRQAERFADDGNLGWAEDYAELIRGELDRNRPAV